MKYDLKALLKSSEASLTQIVDILNTAPSLMLQSLESSNTAIIIVDMVNGFVKEGHPHGALGHHHTALRFDERLDRTAAARDAGDVVALETALFRIGRVHVEQLRVVVLVLVLHVFQGLHKVLVAVVIDVVARDKSLIATRCRRVLVR